MFDAYGGSAFPGVGDILYNINEQVKKNTYLHIAAYWYILNVQEPGTTEYNRLVKVSQTYMSVSQKKHRNMIKGIITFSLRRCCGNILKKKNTEI